MEVVSSATLIAAASGRKSRPYLVLPALYVLVYLRGGFKGPHQRQIPACGVYMRQACGFKYISLDRSGSGHEPVASRRPRVRVSGAISLNSHAVLL